jgi:RNA polymerase sigma-70 factor (ECF subfamily)
MDRLLENQLILRCKEGDSLAFGQLIKNYRKQLFTYLLRLSGNKDMAEDLLQDTLTKAWHGLPKYEEKNKFSSWLFSIAHNIAMDAYRKKKVREVVSTYDEIPERSLIINQEHALEAEELKNTIVDSLSQIPEKQRSVFLMRQHSGMSFKEISDSTGQPLNTVLSHMHYATKKLRKILRDKNVI